MATTTFRSAWYLHRWGSTSPSGPGGWRPPPELGTVASWCLVSRRPSARALLCRAASHWRCSSSRGSSARSHCTGSHARSVWYLHRWGSTSPSGPGGWRPSPELGTVASWCLVSRRPSAPAASSNSNSKERELGKLEALNHIRVPEFELTRLRVPVRLDLAYGPGARAARHVARRPPPRPIAVFARTLPF